MTGFRLSSLAVAVALALAPAAFAESSGQGAHAGHGMMGTQTKAAGTSASHLLTHAYSEAVHGSQSMGMGLTEMARNHYENVVISLEAIPSTAQGASFQSLRDRARQMASNPTKQGGQELVGQFVGLFNQGGGGGGGMPKAQSAHTAADWVAMAQESLAMAQVDGSMRDFVGASLHAEHAIGSLTNAMRSARESRLDATTVGRITGFLAQARSVREQLNQKSQKGATQAGQMVNSLGSALPTMIGSMGGGGGER